MSLPKFIKNLRNKVSKDNPGHEFMEGSLHLNNGLSYHHSYEHEGATYAEISANKANSQKRNVLQLNSSPDENENEALRIVSVDENGNVSGVSNIYGEHFKPSPEDIGAIAQTKLLENPDLNDIINEGTYYILGLNFKNFPSDLRESEFQHSILQVYKYNSLIVQILIITNSKAYDIHARKAYIRVKSFDINWDLWKRFSFIDEVLPLTGGTMTGQIVSQISDAIRMKAGDISLVFRNDGNSFYLIPTDRGNPDGVWGELRPFAINLGTGSVAIGNGLYVTGGIQGQLVGQMNSTGFGNQGLTYYQTGEEFNGNTGWCHYIIANHQDGASYYNVMMALPFWGVPMYRRQEGNNTTNLRDWQTFYTTENVTCGTGSASIDKEKGIYIRY